MPESLQHLVGQIACFTVEGLNSLRFDTLPVGRRFPERNFKFDHALELPVHKKSSGPPPVLSLGSPWTEEQTSAALSTLRSNLYDPVTMLSRPRPVVNGGISEEFRSGRYRRYVI